MKPSILALALAAAVGLAGGASAAEVVERIQGGALAFSGGQGFTNAVLVVTGPNGYEAEKTTARGLPVFRMQGGGGMVDGYYQYSLIAASDEKIDAETKFDNGRGAAAQTTALKPFSMYGAFQVARGLIIPAEDVAAGADGDASE